jgi:phage baseplate assembly protein W
MSIEQSFLGTGWSFPPTFDKASRTVALVRNEEDIEQSLHILLSTSIGERVMQPLYGCNLRDYQFEPVNNTYLGFIKDLVERAILFFEPRINIEKIDITPPEDSELIGGKILISVDYVIAGTNTRNNFVYPFYLEEANNTVK